MTWSQNQCYQFMLIAAPWCQCCSCYYFAETLAFLAPPLRQEDKSPTSIGRQIQTPSASQLHAVVTSGPLAPTRKLLQVKKERRKNYPWCHPPPQSSGASWRILTRLQWCIIDKREGTDCVMNCPACIFQLHLEASCSLRCKTVGRRLHTDVVLPVRTTSLLRSF